MKGLILGSVLIIILLGYLIMDKLDRFMMRGGFVEEKISPVQILLFGEGRLVYQIENYLKEKEMTYELITEITAVEKCKNCGYLLALSEDDVENLMICSLAKKRWEFRKSLALCNDSANQSIFRQYGVKVLERQTLSFELQVSILKEIIKNACA
ncbi:hypothetical protein CS063_10405 [Sporanaerobium hydrogeniformans]|uniref:Uncharacterized protein n=1 Tax=Sporanaerobium hydrogeniformans TaxID=3072179 RepID=A0AC61DD00_9FIRM|nr:hypothetical protein [Sporanaerobium hydrogeniformans]PHV70491.1 hypothetical protein CS063_10405 [Sporanaerobium hydrogeniformans]